VTLIASDGRGGEAVQSYVLGAGARPSNPSAPRITGVPGTRAVVGVLYVYQAVASDPDGDPLPWELTEEAPNAGVMQLVSDLNRLYRDSACLHRFRVAGRRTRTKSSPLTPSIP